MLNVYFITSIIRQNVVKNKNKGEVMKILKITSFILIISVLSSLVCYADNGCNWFIVKRGNETPKFPENSKDVSRYGGIFIDTYAAENGVKKIYLTFDAGYENGNIEKILDIMKDEGVTGAFFILSNLIKKNPDLIKRMVNEGHLVCNHTSNHKDLTRLNDYEIMANLSCLEAQYRDTVGIEMDKIFRFPEGKYSISALKLLHENGYKTVFWSMAYDDWDNSRQMDAELAKQKLLSTTHEGAILLLHPTSSTNAKILQDLIHEWKDMGYSFGSIKDI